MPEGGTVSIRCSNVEVGKNSLPSPQGGQLCEGVHRGPRSRHPPGTPGQDIRSLFYDQAEGERAGPGHELLHHQEARRAHSRRIRSRLGNRLSASIWPRPPKSGLAPRSEEAAIRGGTGRVLVMDDEAECPGNDGKGPGQAGIQRGIRAGWRAKPLKLYREALDAGSGFDLVIMDLTVPGGMGGKDDHAGTDTDRSGGQGHRIERLFQRPDHGRFPVLRFFRCRDQSRTG